MRAAATAGGRSCIHSDAMTHYGKLLITCSQMLRNGNARDIGSTQDFSKCCLQVKGKVLDVMIIFMFA